MLEVLMENNAAADAASRHVQSLARDKPHLRSLFDDTVASAYLTPGLFLHHLHPENASSPEALLAAGVTSWTLAVHSADPREIAGRAASVLASPLARHPGFKGLCLAGPFIPEQNHPPAAAANLNSLLDSLPCKVHTIVFDPECVAIPAFTDELAARGIEPAIGFTSAPYDLCLEAFHRGAKGLVLPFLSTAPLHHRRPGPIAAAAAAGAWAEVPIDSPSFTRQQAAFLAKTFQHNIRPIYHPGESNQPFPVDFARRASIMLSMTARDFLNLYSTPADPLPDTFALFDDMLAPLASVVKGTPLLRPGKAPD